MCVGELTCLCVLLMSTSLVTPTTSYKPDGGADLDFTISPHRTSLFRGHVFLMAEPSAHTPIIVGAGARVMTLLQPVDVLASELSKRDVLFAVSLDSTNPALQVLAVPVSPPASPSCVATDRSSPAHPCALSIALCFHAFMIPAERH